MEHFSKVEPNTPAEPKSEKPEQAPEPETAPEPKAEPEAKAEKAEPAPKHSELAAVYLSKRLPTDPKKLELWQSQDGRKKVLIVDVIASNNVWIVRYYQVDGEVRGFHEIKSQWIGLFTDVSFGYEKMPVEVERAFKRDQFERADRLREKIERKHPRNVSATARELVRASKEREELLREALLADGNLKLMLYFLEYPKKPTDKQPAEPTAEPTALTKRKRTDDDTDDEDPETEERLEKKGRFIPLTEEAKKADEDLKKAREIAEAIRDDPEMFGADNLEKSNKLLGQLFDKGIHVGNEAYIDLLQVAYGHK